MLKELFNKNKNIVINSDIDGMLSGMILQNYFGCNIVGFSNSWNKVWLTPEYEKEAGENAINKPIYIDLFVANPDVVCIEQHIIGYDESHNDFIKSIGTKINPNLMRANRSFTGDYFHKYPFGTVHFLIALMEMEGITVKLPDLKSSPTPRMNKYDIKVGDIILRADDALFSSLGKYKENTDQWWPWLLSKSGNSKSIKSMIDYISLQNPSLNFKVKDKTGKYFHDEFNCDISQGRFGKDYSKVDGAYKDILDNSGKFKSEILKYVEELRNIFGMAFELPTIYNAHIGEANTMKYTGDRNRLIQANWNELYSYAFIYGPNSPNNNFSYTIKMK